LLSVLFVQIYCPKLILNMKYFLVVFFAFSAVLLAAQDEGNDHFFNYKNELGINFTNVLGNVLSLNPNNANSPYGITYRRHGKKVSFRTSFQFDLSSNEDFSFNSSGSFENTNLEEKLLETRIGLEWHLPLTKNFLFSYGLDALFGIRDKYSNIVSFVFNNSGEVSQSFAENSETQYSYGGGPMIRMLYKLSDRVSLSTESSLYFIYANVENTFTTNNVKDSNDKSIYNLKLSLPQSLFINIAF